MGSIRERNNKNGIISYYAEIRKKDIYISCTFSNLSDAELWISYKEDLLDQIDAFDVPKEELITLEDLIELKALDNKEKNSKISYIKDCDQYSKEFIKFFGENRSLKSISYKDIYDYAQKMLTVPYKNFKSGMMQTYSVNSVINRLALLSVWYGIAIRNGCNIENHALKVNTLLRNFNKNNNDKNKSMVLFNIK